MSSIRKYIPFPDCFSGQTRTVASNRQWTTYFRRQFYIGHPNQILALNARLTRDDAAIIYLNGAEVWRDPNITAGPITYTTPASTALGGADETTWLSQALNPSPLIIGWNTLAAEVHNQSLSSTDLGFDFELTADAIIDPLPPLNIATSLGALALSWPAAASYFAVYSATNLAPPITWTRVATTPQLSNGLWPLSISPLLNETSVRNPLQRISAKRPAESRSQDDWRHPDKTFRKVVLESAMRNDSGNSAPTVFVRGFNLRVLRLPRRPVPPKSDEGGSFARRRCLRGESHRRECSRPKVPIRVHSCRFVVENFRGSEGQILRACSPKRSLPFPSFPNAVFDTAITRFMINQKAMNQTATNSELKTPMHPRNPCNLFNHFTNFGVIWSYLVLFGVIWS